MAMNEFKKWAMKILNEDNEYEDSMCRAEEEVTEAIRQGESIERIRSRIGQEPLEGFNGRPKRKNTDEDERLTKRFKNDSSGEPSCSSTDEKRRAQKRKPDKNDRESENKNELESSPKIRRIEVSLKEEGSSCELNLTIVKE